MNIDVGKWLFGSNLLFHLSSNIYPWLILYLTEKDNVAVFGVLMSIASLVNPFLTAMSSYLLPIFVSKNKEYDKVHDSVKKWSIIFLLMGIVLVIIGFFRGQQIISLLYGEKYSNLGVLIVFPFVVQSINITFQPLKIALNAIKRTDINFWILIPRSILAISVGYFLIKEYALLGVFYTMIIDNLFYQIMYLIQYRRVFKLNFSNE